MLTAFFNNMTMRKKMLFIYLVAILIPFFLASVFYARFTYTVIEKQAIEMTRSRTFNYSQNLNSRLGSYITLANMIANNSSFIKKIDEPYRSVLDAYSLYQEIWSQYEVNLQTWPNLRNITIYSQNSSMRNSIPYFIRMDRYMSAQPQYSEIVSSGISGKWYGIRNTSGREYWNPSNIDRPPGRYCTFTYNRIMYSAGSTLTPTGIITIEIDVSSLQDIIKTEAEEGLSIFVFDEENLLLASSNDEWHNEYLPALELADSDNPIMLRHGNFSYYADANTLDNGWRIVALISLENAMKHTQAISSFGWILLLSLSCIVVALIVFFSKHIARRSRGLVNKMEVFMSGEMILGDPLGGHDEIGMLDERFCFLAKELKQRIHETYILQLQKDQFRLQTLQAQINPHFLYNTLSTIAWLSDSAPRSEIRAAVESLASFYRITLSKGKDIIPLSDELKGLDDYIQLQKIRYAGRINVYYHIEELVLATNVPKLTLQPLVENCIRHGLSGERENIAIVVSAYFTGSRVEITIQDDGVGINPEILQKLLTGEIKSEENSGLGLSNINERIKLYFGNAFGLDARSESGNGTLVMIRIPFETLNENDQ